MEYKERDLIKLDQLAEGSERVQGMVVRSVQLRNVLKTVARLSPYKSTVLISGESGTGKEHIARALHSLSGISTPFVIFNCSNLLESLAESQLFGHVKGAFTDAREDSQGFFRAAHGGTLFLDEIGDLPLKLQPKLLRAVEMHEVQPVGSSHSYHVDIRLVAATNRDLRSMVKAGQFRDDLFYRLNNATIFIPPLRRRREAIPAFVGYFIQHFNKIFGTNVEEISRGALELLCNYQWPGNVRELAHAVESAVLLSDSNGIGVADLPPEIVNGSGAEMLEAKNAEALDSPDSEGVVRRLTPMNFAPETPALLLDEVIRQTLVRSLEETEGNRRRAAAMLGVSRSTLYRMLTRYGLEDPRRSP
ncbi:MAG: sigma-54 dependent transcriptional regulator [Candidatus Binatus sp.]|uniref:sigma 54-interacting transcriptional regulator n=1 Tax=Candidatus Binatus sp. TaxID=2811406 RepID=UPI00271F51ED|nr:sigma-54 dependent transcriptional regulator [Candidatus Binatus sp.]MDO8432408.1 sigma-54 dependent transcriptional regulator [Candidatus Binatus sp.]